MSEIKPCPEITQADRDAAADLAAQSTKYSFEWREAGAIRSGGHDNWECVQAFARHRIDACASVQKERDELREIVEAVKVHALKLRKAEHLVGPYPDKPAQHTVWKRTCYHNARDLQKILARYEALK